MPHRRFTVQHLLRNTDNTTSRPCTRIASLLALLVAALAQVICASVHHNCSSDDALWSDQLHELVGGATLGVALAVSLEVA